ncbi:sporulation integral membrane protein YtvI [Zhaonella formicivorans]|jgi:sporulation integral membrane protein YtvI|uniref:sporulation integral membrane protein YtvI n=1 Tax=Zhaonella formicivorans TaxID=2528593 RepID=UPI0010F0EC19|nr:sporulation integral membrane protein YtvI [Zhaonella formicivorans]
MKEISPRLLKFAIKSVTTLSVLIILFLAYYYIIPALKGFIIYLLPIVLPFVLALALAALIDPVVDYLEFRLKIGRTTSVFITLTCLIGGLLAGIVWLIARLISELIRLSRMLPELSGELTQLVLDLIHKTTAFYFSLDIPEQLIQNATTNIEKLANRLTELTGDFLTGTIAFFSSIPSGLLVIIFTLMATFFFSRDKEKIRNSIYRFLPERTAKLIDSVGQEVGTAMVGFIRAQVVLMLITFVQTLAGLYLLGVDYSLLIAIFVGLVDALPVLGPGAVFIPWMIWEFINGQVRLALALLVLYAFVTIVRQLLQPKIVGDSVGMHPLEALIAIYGGLKIFGVLGVIIGPILLIVIKAGWRAWQK